MTLRTIPEDTQQDTHRPTPEEAVATPGGFLRWLTTQKALGRSCIGYSNTHHRCPLAMFAREALGLSMAQVYWRRGQAQGPLRLVLQGNRRLLPPRKQEVELPAWCERFVQRIDGLQGNAVPVDPSCALRLLHEAIEYGSASA